MRATAFVLLGLCLCARSAVAQSGVSQPAASGAKVTSKAEVSLVMVPVVVRDRDGHAVTDLRKEDFQLFDRGKPGEIASFSMVKPPQATTHSIAWVFDDASISDLGAFTRLRAAAARQVAALEPADRVGIFTTSCRVLLDFTDSRAKLREALSRLEFQPVPACAASKVQAIQLAALNSVVRRMAALPARRSIVLMSPGFSVGHDGARDEADLLDSAIRAKLAIDAMDVSGASTGRPADTTVLTELARGTGGTYAASGNDFDAAFRRLAAPESYYVLGFAPSQTADAGFHSLRVKLKDSRKLEVQARSGYFAGKATGTVETAQAAKPADRKLLADAVQDPIAAAKPPVALRVVAQRTTPAGTVVAPAAAPEESANVAEITSRDEPAAFRAETNLVLVTVVVRDAEGHAVSNLRKEDFQLTDKGKRREIARFGIQKTGAPAALSGHFIAYLFDDVHLTSDDLARVRDAARHRIALLPPADRVGIFTTSGMNAPMDFSGDRAKAQAALLDLRPNPIGRPGTPACPTLSYYLAAQADKGDSVARELAMKLAKDCTVDNITRRAIEAGEQESRISLAVARDLVRRMSALSGRRSIILISPGFYLTDSLLPDETNLLDRAIHAGVVIGAIDARGALNASAVQYEQQERNANSEVLAALAEGTGGAFVTNSNDFDGGLKRLAALPECVYTLGFAPEGLKPDGSFHNLQVTVKNPGTVQARRGYHAPKHSGDPAEASKQEIESAVFSRDEIHDLPVELSTQFLKAGDEARLTVLASVDARQMRFRKAEGRNRNDVTVVSSLFDANGNFIVAAQKVVQFRLKDETRKKLAGEPPVTIRTVFNLKPGDYLVRLVARDAEGQQMTAHSSTVEIR
ncbi:MAG: VWA domain-containing protein [Bryobacteraceae bacterium]|jgi:VWFA-related protein